MSIEEIEKEANQKWLAARGVTDWQTMRCAIKAAQGKAVRQFDKFVQAFNEWEFLSELNPDGTAIALNAGTERARSEMRKKLARIGDYIKEAAQ